ncbi:MAG: hypothetical protein JZU70_00855 [Chlorobium sp.]|jgi:hypothetical protein|nr:hypothetical protein [Chlorobium sp.]
MKLKKTSYLVPAIFGLLALHAPDAGAATSSVLISRPNSHGKSLTTPVAWGAANNVVFMGVGGTAPSPYSSKSDGAAVVGVGIGDPKELGVQVSLISLDISSWTEYSTSLHLFRDLGNGDAIGVGVENVMLTNGGDADESFYVVYSSGVQDESVVNKATKSTKLHYSIGAGTGRFRDKSAEDIRDGKGDHGTYVFGNIAYEVAQSFNVITDWNGLNLNAGVSKSFSIGNIPFGVTVGLADLTKNSGDGVRLIGAAGFGFKL